MCSCALNLFFVDHATYLTSTIDTAIDVSVFFNSCVLTVLLLNEC
jgi:hypothetical protein